MQASQFVYFAILAACFVGTLPLEFVLHTHVYARWRQLALTLIPVLVIFGGWDVFAVHRGDWSYDHTYLVGLTLLGGLPVEEVAFFLVIPTCAILALEAVRARRPHWIVGDEPPDFDPAVAAERAGSRPREGQSGGQP